MIISANMATIPSRLKTAPKAIESIYDQVDVIRLYLNQFETVPEEFKDPKIQIKQGINLKSSGKLYWSLLPNQYYFCVDDDILYPKDYVNNSIEKLKEYHEDVIISYHGRIYDKGKMVKNYFSDFSKYFHFLKVNESDIEVNIIGNGVSCWNTNNIKIDYNKFEYHYMDDILVSAQAHSQGKKRIVVAHDKNYFKQLEISSSLYDKYKKSSHTQTKAFKSVNWWR